MKRAIESGTLPKELLICGPAGTGKTYSILAFLHILASDYPGLRILICRQTRVSLTDSVLATYEQEVLPADGMQWLSAGVTRRGRSSYVFPSGSEIVLGGLDNPDRVASSAWDFIYPNEAIELEEEGWETINARLDRPGRDARFGYLIADTNPGDPSHWLKKRCEDGRTVLWDTVHEANPAMHDGRAWTPAGNAYLGRLDRLRGTRRKRLLDGVWAAGEGQWFETFGYQHVSESAAYDPAYPVHLAVDSGVETAAVWFQVRPTRPDPTITVFGDYYSFGVPAFDAARAILAKSRAVCGGKGPDRGVTDPSGKSSTAFGITVMGEYERAGLKLAPWPRYPGSVLDGLKLIESFVAVEPPGLVVHPSCKHLIAAFHNYKRDKRAGQWIDRPIDPQHPHEDLMDALRGGLQDAFPDGRRPKPTFTRRGAAFTAY